MRAATAPLSTRFGPRSEPLRRKARSSRKPLQFKDEIAVKLDREKALTAEQPELRERWKFLRHIDDLNAVALRQWQAYHGRLCNDAQARLDDREESAQ